MGPEEAKQYILDRIDVTRQRVTIAKAFMLKNFDPDTNTLIDRFLDSVNAKMPAKLVLHPSVDHVPVINAAAEALSWKRAACEGVWGLIGVVFPASTNWCGEIQMMEWTNVVPGSGAARVSRGTVDQRRRVEGERHDITRRYAALRRVCFMG
jgi:hypothetical protein